MDKNKKRYFLESVKEIRRTHSTNVTEPSYVRETKTYDAIEQLTYLIGEVLEEL